MAEGFVWDDVRFFLAAGRAETGRTAGKNRCLGGIELKEVAWSIAAHRSGHGGLCNSLHEWNVGQRSAAMHLPTDDEETLPLS